jgi:membrane protein
MRRVGEIASTVYGSFATAAGAFTLLYLVSQGLVVSAEAAAVYSLRLWPRSLHTDAPPHSGRRAGA